MRVYMESFFQYMSFFLKDVGLFCFVKMKNKYFLVGGPKV